MSNDPSPPNATMLQPLVAELEPADTNTPPPDNVPVPPVKLIRPARASRTVLVPSISAPLLPVFDVPELNTSIPLAPPAPPFALRITTLPLLVCVPSPLISTSEPPVRIVLRPPSTLAAPPAPLVPLPTLTVTAPLVPPVAARANQGAVPLGPPFDVPELSTSMPRRPAAPRSHCAAPAYRSCCAVPSPVSYSPSTC